MISLHNLQNILHSKRLLIFDFDGTLVDSSSMHVMAFANILKPFNIKFDYANIAGMKTLDAIKKLLNDANIQLDPIQIKKLVLDKQEYVRQLIRIGLQPMAGADVFLRWARTRYKIAMVTSGSKDTVSLALRQIGYEGWFNPLICAEDVIQAKPAPDGFLMVLERTGILPEDALVFEDSEAGFISATQAKIEYINIHDIPWHVIMMGL